MDDLGEQPKLTSTESSRRDLNHGTFYDAERLPRANGTALEGAEITC